MDFKEYQLAAKRTVNTKLPPEKALLSFLLGLGGETGELQDYLKKCLYHGHKIDYELIIIELGDILWYVAMLADSFAMKLEHIAERNIEKLKERYPEGFDEERSRHRSFAQVTPDPKRYPWYEED